MLFVDNNRGLGMGRLRLHGARGADGFCAQSVVSIQPGKLGRSLTGAAVSARMALLHTKGEPAVGDQLTGTHQHILDQSELWPKGHRLSDTWPKHK